MPDSFSDTDKERLTIAYSKAILQELNPSLKKMSVFRKKNIYRLVFIAGISNIPGGKEYYNWLTK